MIKHRLSRDVATCASENAAHPGRMSQQRASRYEVTCASENAADSKRFFIFPEFPTI